MCCAQFSLFQLCIIAAYALLLLGVFVPLLVAWRGRLLRARLPPTSAPSIPTSSRRFLRLPRRLPAPLAVLLVPAEHAFWLRLAPSLYRRRLLAVACAALGVGSSLALPMSTLSCDATDPRVPGSPGFMLNVSCRPDRPRT